MSSLPSAIREPSMLDRFRRWLDAMPHPSAAVEVAPSHVAAIRGGHALETHAVESLPAGAVAPSPVELNVADPAAVREALRRVLHRVPSGRPEVALLLPDQVVRVFLLHFETFPRRAEEAIPLLRWRLKKSVPFDVEDTVVSYVTQPARGAGVDVLAGVARQKIVRQYEELLEGEGLHPGVALGATLATLPLLDEGRTTLLARMTGTTLTTVIVRGELLCVYRCTEMPAEAAQLEPQALLDEIYPAVAFYQDTWQEGIQQVRLAGLAARFDDFRSTLESELSCSVSPLASSSVLQGRLGEDAKAMVARQLDALVGWVLNRGA